MEFNTSTNHVRIFQGGSATTVSNPLIAGGTYVIDFTRQADVSGVTITNPLLAGGSNQSVLGDFRDAGGHDEQRLRDAVLRWEKPRQC